MSDDTDETGTAVLLQPAQRMEYRKDGWSRPWGSTEDFKKYPRARTQQISTEGIIGLIDEKTAVKKMARRMTSMAISALARVCEHGKNEAARVSAAREILDRGWGKSHFAPENETRPGGHQIEVVFGERPKVNVVEAKAIESDDDAEES